MKILRQTTHGNVTKGILQDETTGQQLPFAMLNEKHQVSIWFNGQVNIQPKQIGKTKNHDTGSKTLQDITAPMPGRVLKIPVEPGQQLDAGQAVVIMESMKMELSLTAETACTVGAIQCKPEDKVDMNQVLVKLMPLSTQENQ